MKKVIFFNALFFLITIPVLSQNFYQVSYSYLHAPDSISFKALFVSYDDSKGIVRLKYVSPTTKENMLVAMDFMEEIIPASSPCYKKDLIFYKLQNPEYIDGNDRTNILPGYFSFKKNDTTGLFEPFAVSNRTETCIKTDVRFSTVEFMEAKDISKDFVLQYFKVTDRFYRNLFVTNNTRALTVSERNTRLILLVVANVFDPVIGSPGRKDMMNTITFFKKITGFLGIQFVLMDTITGDRYTKVNVEKAIKDIRPNPNDIVVFYFTGHGFRKPRDNRRPPYIDLRNNYRLSYMNHSLSMEDIFNSIRSRGARLNLVLSDCCNDLVTSTNPMANPPAAKKGFGMNWSTQNCRDLFLNAAPISILATASEPGQLATCNENFGGFFSYFFRSALETHFSFFKNKVTWESVFAETKSQTKFKADHTYCSEPYIPANICKQLPYVSIRYGRF